LLAALLLISGCAGIQPYEPRNHREDGPQNGLFTGSEGEWVIPSPRIPQIGTKEKGNAAPESESEREEKHAPEEPAEGNQ